MKIEKKIIKQYSKKDGIVFVIILITLIICTIFLIENRFGRYDKNDYYSKILNSKENAIEISKDEFVKMVKGLKSVREIDPDLSKEYQIYEFVIEKDGKLYDATALIKKYEENIKVFINNEIESYSEKDEFAAIYSKVLNPDDYEKIEFIDNKKNENDKNTEKIYKYKDKKYVIKSKIETSGNFEVEIINFEECN